MRSWHITLGIILVLGALDRPASAQALRPGDEVRIRIRGGASDGYGIVRLTGSVLDIEAGRLRADFGEGPRSLRLDSIIRLDVVTERSRSRGVLRGAFIGMASAGAVGFLLGMSNPQPDSGPLISESVDSGLMAGAVLAVPGALVGALIGAARPGTVWERVLPSPER